MRIITVVLYYPELPRLCSTRSARHASAMTTEVSNRYLYGFCRKWWAWRTGFLAQNRWWAPIETWEELTGFHTAGNWFQPVSLA